MKLACFYALAELASFSCMDMRVAGNTTSAVERWRSLLANESGRTAVLEIVEQFRARQERRFARKHLGARYADALAMVTKRRSHAPELQGTHRPAGALQ